MLKYLAVMSLLISTSVFSELYKLDSGSYVNTDRIDVIIVDGDDGCLVAGGDTRIVTKRDIEKLREIMNK